MGVPEGVRRAVRSRGGSACRRWPPPSRRMPFRRTTSTLRAARLALPRRRGPMQQLPQGFVVGGAAAATARTLAGSSSPRSVESMTLRHQLSASLGLKLRRKTPRLSGANLCIRVFEPENAPALRLSAALRRLQWPCGVAFIGGTNLHRCLR